MERVTRWLKCPLPQSAEKGTEGPLVHESLDDETGVEERGKRFVVCIPYNLWELSVVDENDCEIIVTDDPVQMTKSRVTRRFPLPMKLLIMLHTSPIG